MLQTTVKQWLLPVVVVLSLQSLASVQAQTPLQTSDYLEFEQVSDPQLSPEGTQIVYTRRWVDKQKDSWKSSLWIVNADGSQNRFLIDGSNARWSPSGDRLLFLAPDSNSKPQLFIRWMKTADNTVSQVTRSSHAPQSPVWSPKGDQIAFTAIVPDKGAWKVDMPAAPEGASWTKPPRIVERLHYRQDRVGQTEPGFSHLFVVTADSGSSRQITTGKWNVGAQVDGLFAGADLEWTPDGTQIIFDGWNALDGDLVYRRSHVYAYELASGNLKQLTQDVGFWTEPAVSRDGKFIAYLGYPATEKTYEMPRLHVMRIDGSGARQISANFDRPPSQLTWDAEHRGVYFSAEDNGYGNVFHLNLDGVVRRVTSSKQVIGLDSSDARVRQGVGIRSDANEPGDVYLFTLTGKENYTRLTAVNQDLLKGKTLGQQKDLWFTASDGNRAHGWLITPPDFDPKKRYPLIMEIHGGPFSMYRGNFSFMYQLFAAKGYVVLYTNPRGSTGYGEAFSQGIDRAYPSVDYLDLIAAIDASIAEGYVDPSRMYVGGCSGGGVLSSWMIGQSNRFAGAAVRCPVANWLSMAGTTDIPGFTYSFFDAPFWQNPSKWLEHSPLMLVGKVTTPTIVMTGEQDLRTPMGQSEEYYAALKMRGIPSKLIRFNEEYHGTGTKPSNWMYTVLYMLDWYGDWKRNPDGAIVKIDAQQSAENDR
jgi:dipeptidyl aminopeptidase/acylaminoacyl peptidase